jgi:dienelactone hydrolase
LDGQLFVPAGGEAKAVVILAPGSGGVSGDNLKHAQALTSAGLAVYILDPFAGRGIKNTRSDQSQLTHAASAYDVLAAARMLATQSNIDGQRIGALGYSRGGAAVLLAVHQQMTRAVLGEGKSLRAALVGWPLCIFQFAHALTAPTVVRFLVGDSDNRTSPAHCQAQAMAMRANNPHVSIRLFKDAYHGFGYSFPLREFPNIQRARLNSPILYLNDQGAFLDLHTGEAIPGIDQFTYTKKLGLAEKVTAVTGTKPGQSEAFVEDMVSFFKLQLQP